MVNIGKKVYLFGGFAREPFNDTRQILELGDTGSGKFVCQPFENLGEEGIDHP